MLAVHFWILDPEQPVWYVWDSCSASTRGLLLLMPGDKSSREVGAMKLKGKLLLVGMTLLLVSGIALSGCSSGVSQEDYDAAVTERDTAQAKVADLEADVAEFAAGIAALETEVADLKAQLAVLPENITALLSVADEMETMVTEASAESFGAMGAAVTAAANDDLTSEWDKVTATLPDFTAARAQMLQMVAWILAEVAQAVP